MKIAQRITVNGKVYEPGAEVPWFAIYPFFMVHMLMFGASGFFMAYSGNKVPVAFLYMHGGFAILVYVIFYVAIFGVDEVKWMFTNAALGLLGIYTQIGWILSRFGKQIGDYPFYVHIVPFMYFVLYTFLLRHAVLDLLGAREDPAKKRSVEYGYIVVSVGIYLVAYILERN